MSDHERYAEWDAAYVLGALGAADRREFEDHSAGCPDCRSAVAELAGVPGLLGALSAADAFAMLEVAAPGASAAGGEVVTPATSIEAVRHAPAAEPTSRIPPPSDLLARLHARVTRARRIRSWTVGSLTVALAAAAAVVGLVLPGAIDAVQHPAVAVSLQQTMPGPVSASVRLTSLPWGTSISMTCTYHGAVATYPGYPIDYRYGLYVVDRAGTTTRVSTWTALPDRTITTEGSTATPAAQLVRIELRDLDTGTVLLSRQLG
ncbi:MAG TPA: zf-HC2 domain-containing protein [Humibacter sp.]|nr:zf-HC2 domain-containing protein [Humibacter sp.]